MFRTFSVIMKSLVSALQMSRGVYVFEKEKCQNAIHHRSIYCAGSF